MTKRIVSACFASLIGFWPIAGCEDGEGEGNGTESTAALCRDGEDNDGDGAVDCDDAECAAFGRCDSSSDMAGGEVSSMPIPPVDDVPEPSGAAGNLVVLDWAGFKAALTYTFDDSHPSHVEHYDALRDTGVRMTFFVVSSVAADVEAWRRAVEDGHEMGNHTAHHCHAGLSGECAFGEALESPEAEIEECAEFIVEELGQPGVWTMATPYGESWWSLFYAEDYFFLSRSVNSGTISPNDDADPFNLPSVMLQGDSTAASLIEDIDSARAGGEWLIFCVHALLPTVHEASWGVDIDVVTDSVERASGLKDIWLDSMVNVGAYWMAQKIMNAVEPDTDGQETVWTWSLPDHFPPGKYLRVTVDGGTLKQNGRELAWSPHGYYEVALDEGSLTLSP